MPAGQIQVGRAPDDDETWADLLDAETDDPWMRNPQAGACCAQIAGRCTRVLCSRVLPLPLIGSWSGWAAPVRAGRFWQACDMWAHLAQ